MNKLMKFIMPGMVALMLPVSSGMAVEASTVATAQENIVVYTTGTVTLSLTPVSSIIASSYESGLILARWSASTTAGSIAVRLNPTTMKSINTLTGVATSTTNTANTIPLTSTTTECNGSDISGWYVCGQGNSSVAGSLITRNNQSIAVGTYPLSMDAAIWQY